MKKIKEEYYKIRALIIEDYRDGSIKVEYNKNKFDEVLQETTFWEVTKLYDFTIQQRNDIIKKIFENAKNTEDVNNMNITEDYMIKEIMPNVTDMPFDLNNDEDKKLYDKLVNNPNALIITINKEINNMILEIIGSWMKEIKTIGNLPKELQDVLEKSVKQEDLENKKGKEEIKENLEKIENEIGK